jgi:hypothetical protein
MLWRSITSNHTARKKLLQTATFKTVRAMRSVLYSAYQVRSPPYRDLLTDRGPFKAALNAFVAEERALEDLGA